MSNELTTIALAVEINSLHNESSYHAGEAVIFAVRAGAKLNEVKANLPYREFEDWLNSDACKINQTDADRFMNLADDIPDLIYEGHHAILPSVQQAIELLFRDEN